MTELSYLGLAKLVAPEIIVLLAALVVLGIDLLVLADVEPRMRARLCASFATAGCAAAMAWMFAFPNQGESGWPMFEVTLLTQMAKGSILVLAILSMWLVGLSGLSRHIGEYFCLLLLSATGMMLLISGRDLLTIFVSLELATVPLYALAGFQKESPDGAQSALKYFLFGGMSAAITLFGFSLLYGFSGAIGLNEIAAAASARASDPLLVMGSVMVVGGVGFKIAAAPFHLWAPEVYRAAPTASAAFIGSASKVAGILALGVVLTVALGEEARGWQGAVAIAATFSIVLGNLAALVQRDLRRLLAFSAVSHAGYMLMALIGDPPDALPAVFYYATTYGVATLGAFAVAGLVVEKGTAGNNLHLDGLHSRNPLVAACMLVFMLSLAGIPPLAGFMGKFVVFSVFIKAGPLDPERLALLLLALAGSAVSLYYYLLVLKSVYVRPPEGQGRLAVGPGVKLLLVVMALIILAAGILPQSILGSLAQWAGK